MRAFPGLIWIGSWKSSSVKPFEWCQPFDAFARYFGTNAVGMGEIFGAILEEPLVPASQLRAGVPKEIDAIIARCLARKVDDRYSDVAEIARAIAPFGSGKWNHLVETIEQSFRARIVRMTGPEAFAPMAVPIVMTPEETPEPPKPAPEPEPLVAKSAPPAPRSSTTWVLVLLIVVGAGVAGWILLGR